MNDYNFLQHLLLISVAHKCTRIIYKAGHNTFVWVSRNTLSLWPLRYLSSSVDGPTDGGVL